MNMKRPRDQEPISVQPDPLASDSASASLGSEDSDDSDSTSEEENLPENYSSDDNDENDKNGKNDNDDDDIEEEGISDEDSVNKKHSFKIDEEDTSDEEDIRNTVGNIPLEWYRDLDHLGYDIHGNKIMKPVKGDAIDDFISKMENLDYWRTVTDKWTGQTTVLSDEDVDIIKRLQRGANPSASQDNYPEWVDFFSGEEMIHPVTNQPQSKRSFIPSKWEKLKVGQMVHSIKMGWMKPRRDKTEEEEEEEKKKRYDLWADTVDDSILKRYQQRIPAPKTPLPGHVESYNPPPEYLFTKEEEEKWKEQEPEDRRINFLPQKYSCMRLVPAYSKFINERFERCLDLYLCARQRKMKMNVNPEDLIPKLPKPKDLEPFPRTQALVYLGHTDVVRTISPDPSGQWLASGSDDGTVRFWEVATGRCKKTVDVGQKVKSVAWNPNTAQCLVAAAFGTTVVIINPGLADTLIVSNTDSILSQEPDTSSSDKELPVDWIKAELNLHDYKSGVRLRLEHRKEVAQVTWHGKGDYFATVMHNGEKQAVLIHQLSKRHSQSPFSKSKGWVQCVSFHPVQPFLYVATQRFVRVYNLVKQQLTKKLQSNCKWVSSMDIHPGGDNVIIGSFDCKTSWFDIDLSAKPYHTLRHHKSAVRSVAYHKHYPLFASASDDGSVIVCHGKVYSDLLQNPLIVPVKVLRGHKITNKLGVMDCKFHPSQPWVFSAGADSTVRLYHN